MLVYWRVFFTYLIYDKQQPHGSVNIRTSHIDPPNKQGWCSIQKNIATSFNGFFIASWCFQLFLKSFSHLVRWVILWHLSATVSLDVQKRYLLHPFKLRIVNRLRCTFRRFEKSRSVSQLWTKVLGGSHSTLCFCVLLIVLVGRGVGVL